MHPIEKWFTGKALTVIREYVLPTLEEARGQGYWPKGAARKVRAALNKQNVAAKFARANERPFGERGQGLLGDVREERNGSSPSYRLGGAWDVLHTMAFGLVARAPALIQVVADLEPLIRDDDERKALAVARQWVEDFAPIAELLARLDSARVALQVKVGELSPTVLANISSNLGISLKTLRSPPVEWRWEEMVLKDGQTCTIRVGRIVWPEGTRHDQSRFAWRSRSGNEQCHACGHAIKDPHNWVPLVGDTETHPVSLWVGRDCAKRIFQVDVEGEALFEEKT